MNNEISMQRDFKSHPMRVCGLKLDNGVCFKFGFYVTPYAGVWIETKTYIRY